MVHKPRRLFFTQYVARYAVPVFHSLQTCVCVTVYLFKSTQNCPTLFFRIITIYGYTCQNKNLQNMRWRFLMGVTRNLAFKPSLDEMFGGF